MKIKPSTQCTWKAQQQIKQKQPPKTIAYPFENVAIQTETFQQSVGISIFTCLFN
uniref:Uncharacterized protein n=1 Tax=Rhizophora mucronata TaxID=61149 RepID=A0A2P2PAT8_RHIMU